MNNTTDMLDEYDFSNGTRGKYANLLLQQEHLVHLDDDVAELFPTAIEVNEALRTLGQLIQRYGALHS